MEARWLAGFECIHATGLETVLGRVTPRTSWVALEERRASRDPLAAPVTIEFPSPMLAAAVHGGCFTIPHLVGSHDRVAAPVDAAKTDGGIAGAIMTYPSCGEGARAFGVHVQA